MGDKLRLACTNNAALSFSCEYTGVQVLPGAKVGGTANAEGSTEATYTNLRGCATTQRRRQWAVKRTGARPVASLVGKMTVHGSAYYTPATREKQPGWMTGRQALAGRSELGGPACCRPGN